MAQIGGTARTIESVEKLENGNLKVKVTYFYEEVERDDNENIHTIYKYQRLRENTIVLKLSGNSFTFVSCINESDNRTELLDKYSYESEATTSKDEKDKTTATGTIPKTGSMENLIICLIIITISVIGTIVFIKTKKIKEI